MNNEIVFLSVGRADCNILFSDIIGTRHCGLIDAGCFLPGGKYILRDFLRRRNITEIDFLVITHLHADHHNMLCTLMGEFKVNRLVLPTAQPLEVTPKILQTQPGNKYLNSLADLSRFAGHCLKADTRVEDVMNFAMGGSLPLGDLRLRCLYPFPDSRQPSVDYALRMCQEALPDSDCIAFETLSRKHANGDSSVWVLEKGDEQLALFCADAPEATLRAIMAREPLRPRLVRLPHHGLHEGYFSKELINDLAPDELIVSAGDKNREWLESTLGELFRSCKASLRFTFQGDQHWFFD